MDNETHQLIGRHVSVDMGAEGVYVGELLELTGSPWCGRVRITGVVTPARHFDQSGIGRRGHRPGEFLAAAEKAVAPTKERGHATYLEALQAQLGRNIGSHSGFMVSTHPWVLEAFARALRVAMLAEERRIASGKWQPALVEAELLVG